MAKKMIECTKCNGKGYIQGFAHVDMGICYDCKGTGLIDANKKEYVDYNAQRHGSKHAEYTDKLESKYNETERHGFNIKGNKQIHIVNIKNTYKIKDELKQQGAKWNGEYETWYLAESNKKYKTIDITEVVYKYTNEQREQFETEVATLL